MSSRRASAPDSGPISLNVVSQRGYVSVDGYRKEIAQLKQELQRKTALLETQQKEAAMEGDGLRRQRLAPERELDRARQREARRRRSRSRRDDEARRWRDAQGQHCEHSHR